MIFNPNDVLHVYMSVLAENSSGLNIIIKRKKARNYGLSLNSKYYIF